MTKEEILAELPEHETVFGLKRPPLKDGENKIAEIATSELTVGQNGIFWPGPNGEAKPTMYFYSDYGYTWAYTREDLHPIERTDGERNG